jgi:hypothetical protein
MGHLLLLVALDAVIGLSFIFGVMYVVAGWRWSDLRDVLLHDAYRSFTFEGDRIPGLGPGIAARLTIRWLSDPDDRRLLLAPEVRIASRHRTVPAFDRLLLTERELANDVVFRAR